MRKLGNENKISTYVFVPKSFVSKLLFLLKLCKESCSIISCSTATKSRQSNYRVDLFITYICAKSFSLFENSEEIGRE